MTRAVAIAAFARRLANKFCLQKDYGRIESDTAIVMIPSYPSSGREPTGCTRAIRGR